MNTVVSPDKFYLSDEEVAARFGVSTDSIRRWIREGIFPKPVRIGKGTSRWRLTDLETYEANLRVAYCATHICDFPIFDDADQDLSDHI